MASLSPLQTLQTYLRWSALLLVWAEMPWEPCDVLPTAAAAVLTRMQSEEQGLPEITLPLAAMPAVPILSLDPSARLWKGLAQAGKEPVLVRSQGDVIQPGRLSVLLAGGDLHFREGVLLTWADVAALRTDAGKRYLLDEAARVCKDGAVLLVRERGGDAFARVWRQALAPGLRPGVAYAVGPGPWPEGIEVVQMEAVAVLEELSMTASPVQAAARHTQQFEALLAERAVCLRRLLSLEQALIRRPHDVDLQMEAQETRERVEELEAELDALLDEG